MKLKHIILFAILLIACTSTSSELPTDKQKNWCYGILNSEPEIGVEAVNLISIRLKSAIDLYNIENDTNNGDPSFTTYYYPLFSNLLTQGDKEALRICKIWADMNNID